MEQSHQPFETWGILEVMGHKKYAGRITEQVIAGSALIRVDVPACVDNIGQPVEKFSKLVGVASVYCLTPTTEDVARRAAAQLALWENSFPIPVQLPAQIPASSSSARWDVTDVEAEDIDDGLEGHFDDDVDDDEVDRHLEAEADTSREAEQLSELTDGAGEKLTRTEAFDLIGRAMADLDLARCGEWHPVENLRADVVELLKRETGKKGSASLTKKLFLRILKDASEHGVLRFRTNPYEVALSEGT